MRAKTEQGDADAQYNLGLRYGTGEGVPQDHAEAVRWLRLAADQGYAEAQNNLGFMYATGRGVPQNDAEAVRWYGLAADQGHASAQHVIWLDEEPPAEVHTECVLRITATGEFPGGIIMLTFTPVEGWTQLVSELIEKSDKDGVELR